MSELELMLDREAIRGVIFRYVERLDARDATGVAACFTADARLSFNDGAVCHQGHDQIHAVYAVALGGGPGANGERTTHLTSNTVIDLDGDHATGTTKVVAYLLKAGVIRVRGLQFDDRFVRTPNGWLFAERAHRADWQSEMPAVEVTMPRFVDAR